MKKHEALLYPRAYRDIEDINSYIALEKPESDIAKGLTDRIWDAIASLERLPYSHQDRLVGRYAGSLPSKTITSR